MVTPLPPLLIHGPNSLHTCQDGGQAGEMPPSLTRGTNYILLLPGNATQCLGRYWTMQNQTDIRSYGTISHLLEGHLHLMNNAVIWDMCCMFASSGINKSF